MLLPSAGYGRCYRCRRPWWAADPHEVGYAPGRAQFALCKRCWGRSGVGWRWHAHAYTCRHPTWSAEETWAILAAVEREPG